MKTTEEKREMARNSFLKHYREKKLNFYQTQLRYYTKKIRLELEKQQQTA